MIRLFRNYNSIGFLLLLIYTFCLQINLVVNPQEWQVDSASNLFNLISPVLDFVSFGNYHVLLAIFSFLLFGQAMLVTTLVNSNEFHERNSFIAGATYVLLLSLFNRQLFMSPAFFALFFVILAIARLFYIHRHKGFTHIFDTGFFVSIAGLFYQPAFLLVTLVPYGLFQASIIDWKAWATSALGFFTPLYLMAIYLFISGNWAKGNLSSALAGWSLVDLPILTNNLMLVKMALLLSLFVLSIFFISRKFLKSTVQLRRYLSFMILATALSLLISIFAGTHFGQALSLASIPLAVLMGYFFFETKRGMVVELIHLACLTAVIVIQFTVES